MIDEKPVQSFDLPEECDLGHAAIYPNDDPDGPDFYAVPFVLNPFMDEGVDSDGWDHYHEPHNFTVTETYRQVVAELADVSIKEIELDRDIPTTTLEL